MGPTRTATPIGERTCRRCSHIPCGTGRASSRQVIKASSSRSGPSALAGHGCLPNERRGPVDHDIWPGQYAVSVPCPAGDQAVPAARRQAARTPAPVSAPQSAGPVDERRGWRFPRVPRRGRDGAGRPWGPVALPVRQRLRPEENRDLRPKLGRGRAAVRRCPGCFPEGSASRRRPGVGFISMPGSHGAAGRGGPGTPNDRSGECLRCPCLP